MTESYVDNGDFAALESRTDRRCFVIGRTGAGKSAAFVHLRQRYPERVITIEPENLSLPYVTNIDVLQQLIDLDVRAEPFFRALWKHIILVEILRHRYKINSFEKQQNIMSWLKSLFEHDANKKMALEYLEKFGTKFWCDTDIRVKEIVDDFKHHVEVASRSVQTELVAGPVSGSVGVSGGSKRSTEAATQVRSEVRSRFQGVVNESQLPRLNQMIVILGETVLKSDQDFTYLLIDDLDRDWVDSRLTMTLIRCLFDAVIDLSRVRNLKILIALRSNLFAQMDYGSQLREYQEEKVRGLVVPIQWTGNDLKVMLDERIHVASRLVGFRPPLSIKELLPSERGPYGDPLEYLLDRTLMRPRDAIAFCNLALREGVGRRRLSWDHITSAESAYSRTRLDALRDEWKDPYTDIDKVCQQFRRAPVQMSRQEFSQRLDDVALLVADASFRGTPWLERMASPLWGSNSCTNWMECYGDLARLLYEISFIGVSNSRDDEMRYSYDVDFQSGDIRMDAEAAFSVHPAFHAALEIRRTGLNSGR